MPYFGRGVEHPKVPGKVNSGYAGRLLADKLHCPSRLDYPQVWGSSGQQELCQLFSELSVLDFIRAGQHSKRVSLSVHMHVWPCL